jgi:hypothetical protein
MNDKQLAKAVRVKYEYDIQDSINSMKKTSLKML